VCLFPPLGDAETIARAALALFAVGVTYAAFHWRDGLTRVSKRAIMLTMLFAIVSFFVYLALFLRFERRVDIPSEKTAVFVTVGSERTPFADSNFPAYSDEDMLRARGPYEEQVRLLWTYKSLVIARLALYISYCGTVLGFVAAFSLGVIPETRHVSQHGR